MWRCPRCFTTFGQLNPSHSCTGMEAYAIDGSIPNGGPGKAWDAALNAPLPRQLALQHAMQLCLSLPGASDARGYGVDRRGFDKAILVYRPRAKFGDPNNLDRADYAGRAAWRLLNQAFNERAAFPGHFSRHAEVKRIAEGLRARILALAKAEQVDPFGGEVLS